MDTKDFAYLLCFEAILVWQRQSSESIQAQYYMKYVVAQDRSEIHKHTGVLCWLQQAVNANSF